MTAHRFLSILTIVAAALGSWFAMTLVDRDASGIAHSRPVDVANAHAPAAAVAGTASATDAEASADRAETRRRRQPGRLSHDPLVVSLDPQQAPNRASGRVLTALDQIRGSMKKSWYQHKTKVSRRRGHYGWDCSGMTTWILEKAAPRARKALHRDRPVATTFLKTIKRAPTDRARRGWQHIANIADVRPGDIFAWKRPKEWGKGVTGHVGFVVSQPQPVAEVENAYVVRIVDSTRYPHENDTRSPEGTGFGFGTVLFVTDDAGKPTAYGWYGALSRGVVFTDVAFGRVSR